MVASYLTTDIIVIIVLVVVIVIIGICAFFIHCYWTKIGVAEIWNTAKWSSMRSSFYRTVSRFSRRKTSKFDDQESLSRVSIHSEDINPTSLQNKKSSPVITSYSNPLNITYANNYLNKPVSVIPYQNSIRQNYATRTGQSIDNTRIHHNQQYDLAGMIHKQRF